MSAARASEPPALVLTCEHASHDVPAGLASLFARHGKRSDAVLTSHRGWDPGALQLARQLQAATGTPLLSGRWSRLVVDLNRSEDHRSVFSEFTQPLDADRRERLLARYHRPHRARVEAAVTAAIARHGRVLHVGVHSFTPVLHGRRRDMDVGLLDDPRRAFERRLSRALQADLQHRAPGLRVALNRPYRGWSDGLTTSLRRRFGPAVYAGIELEINQRHVRRGGQAWADLRRQVVEAVTALVRAD